MTTVQDKQLVDNVVKHATTHNRVIEEEACWRQILHRRNERGRSASSFSSSNTSNTRDSRRRLTHERRNSRSPASNSSWSKVSQRSPRSANVAAKQQALDAYERELRHQAKKEIELAAAQKLPGVAVPQVELTDRWGHDGWEALQRPGPPVPAPSLGSRMRPASYRLMPLVQRTIENTVHSVSQSSDLSGHSSVRKRHKSKRSRKGKKRKHRRRDNDSESESPSSHSRSPSNESSSADDSDDKRSSRKKRKKRRKEKKRRKRYGRRRARKGRRRKRYSSSSSRSSSWDSRSRTRSRTRRSVSSGSRSRSSRSCSCCGHSDSRSGSYSSRSRSMTSSCSSRDSHSHRRGSSSSSFDSQKVANVGPTDTQSHGQTSTAIKPPSNRRDNSLLNESIECPSGKASTEQTPMSRALPFPESDRELPSDISESGRRKINSTSVQSDHGGPSPVLAPKQSVGPEPIQDDPVKDYPEVVGSIREGNLQEGHVQVYPDDKLNHYSPVEQVHVNVADELYDPVLAVSDTPSQSPHEKHYEDEIICISDNFRDIANQENTSAEAVCATIQPGAASPVSQHSSENITHQDNVNIGVAHQSTSPPAESIPLPAPIHSGDEKALKTSHSQYDDLEGVPLDFICIPPGKPNTSLPSMSPNDDKNAQLFNTENINMENVPLESICIPPLPSPKLPDEGQVAKLSSASQNYTNDVPLDSIYIPPVPDVKELPAKQQRFVSQRKRSPEQHRLLHPGRQASVSSPSSSGTSSFTAENVQTTTVRSTRSGISTSPGSSTDRKAKKARRRRRSTASVDRKGERRKRKQRSESSGSSPSRSRIHRNTKGGRYNHNHRSGSSEGESSVFPLNSPSQLVRDVQVSGTFANRIPKSSEARRASLTESVSKLGKARRNRKSSASSQEPTPTRHKSAYHLEPNEVDYRQTGRGCVSLKETIPSGPSSARDNRESSTVLQNNIAKIGNLEKKGKLNKGYRIREESSEEGEVSSSPSPIRPQQAPMKNKKHKYDHHGFRSHKKSQLSGPMTISPFKVFSRQQKMSIHRSDPNPPPKVDHVVSEPPKPPIPQVPVAKVKTKHHGRRRADSLSPASGVDDIHPGHGENKKKRHRKHRGDETELAVPFSVAEPPIEKVNQWQEHSIRKPGADRHGVVQQIYVPNQPEIDLSSKRNRSSDAKARDFGVEHAVLAPQVSQQSYLGQVVKQHSSVKKKKRRHLLEVGHVSPATPIDASTSYRQHRDKHEARLHQAPESVGHQLQDAKKVFPSRSKHDRHRKEVSPETMLPHGKYVDRKHAVALADIPPVAPVKIKSNKRQANDPTEISLRHPLAPDPNTVEEKLTKDRKGRDKHGRKSISTQQAHISSQLSKRYLRQQSSQSDSSSSASSSDSDHRPQFDPVLSKPGKRERQRLNPCGDDTGRHYHANGAVGDRQFVISKKKRPKHEESRTKKSKNRSKKLSAKQLADLDQEIRALISMRMLAGRRKLSRKHQQSSSSSSSSSGSYASDGGISSLQSDEEIAWKEPS